MSRATLLVAREDGAFSQGIEYSNSWLGAMAIWTALFDRYVPKRFEYDSVLGDEGKRVWALADDERLTPQERIALLITFDNCVVGRDEMRPVADALEWFAQHRAPHSHLSAWAHKLRELSADPTVRAVAFHHTSVSENPWWNRPETDEDGEQIDPDAEDAPYSLDAPLADRRHWFLFDEHPELGPTGSGKRE